MSRRRPPDGTSAGARPARSAVAARPAFTAVVARLALPVVAVRPGLPARVAGLGLSAVAARLARPAFTAAVVRVALPALVALGVLLVPGAGVAGVVGATAATGATGVAEAAGLAEPVGVAEAAGVVGAAEAAEAIVSDAAATVVGSVRARPEDGGMPLGHAMVELVPLVDFGGRPAADRDPRPALRPRSLLADPSGRYVFRDIEPGMIRIRASYVGYAPTEVEVLVAGDAPVEVDLTLTRRAVELAPIVVSAGRLDIGDPDGRTTPAALDARTLVEIRSLEISPGLSEAGLGAAVADPGSGGGDDGPGDALLFRGSSTDLKLVLLDGAPVYAPFHLGGLLPAFDPQVMGGAELHVGGAPARYDGGLSYILDLRTRRPRRDRLRGGGSADLMGISGFLETPLGSADGPAGLLVSGRGLHGLGGTLAGGEGSPYGYADGLARLDAGDPDATGPGHLSLTAFANREAVHLDVPTMAPADDDPDSPDLRPTGPAPGDAAWANRVLAGTWRKRVDEWELGVTGSGSRYEAELPLLRVRTGDDGSTVTETLLAHGRTDRSRLAAELVRPGESGPFRVGASLDRVAVRYGSEVVSQRGPVSRSAADGEVLGAWVEGARSLGDEVDLRWGARVDAFDPGGVRGAGRMALLWSVVPDALLTVAAGRYHQLTRRSDVDLELAVGDPLQAGTGAVPTTGAGGAPLLSVATADHLVVSLDQRLSPTVRLGTELFVKHFRDLPGVAADGVTSSGVDLRIVRAGERTTWWMGYALAWFFESGGESEFTGRHLLSAGARTPLAGPTGLDLRISFSDGLPLTAIPFGPANQDGFVSESRDVPLTGTAGSPGQADVADGFLRIDAEVFAEWTPTPWGHATRIRPYLKVLNALDRRDALFYYFEPWRDEGLRPLAELALVPVLGVEWRF